MYDNTDPGNMRLIAEGQGAAVTAVWDGTLWDSIQGECRYGD